MEAMPLNRALEWHRKNRDRALARMKAYYQNNKEAQKLKRKLRYAENRADEQTASRIRQAQLKLGLQRALCQFCNKTVILLGHNCKQKNLKQCPLCEGRSSALIVKGNRNPVYEVLPCLNCLRKGKRNV